MLSFGGIVVTIMKASFENIQQALSLMRSARERLRARNADTIIHSIACAATNWMPAESVWRRRAVEEAPAHNGFSPAMVNEAVTLTFGEITEASLGAMLDRELGNRHVLDKFCPVGGLNTHARGPQLITHMLAGNVPFPGIASICCGLLLKSGNLVKASHRDPVLPSLFVASLREVDPMLADCVAVLEWEREEVSLTQFALAQANAVIVYGDDRTVAMFRPLAPQGAPFLGYGHKFSFGYVGKEALTASNLPVAAAAAAFDASVYDQQGCLSPHVIFVEERGELGPRKFAAALAQAMADYQARVPRGALSTEDAAAFTQLRDSYEFRSASDKRVAVWRSTGTNDWSVVYEDDPTFTPSCLNRTVFVKPTDSFERILPTIQRFSPQISTVGVTPLNERTRGFSPVLAKHGVFRLCPLGEMQKPPLMWHHDGRPNLAELVRWMDVG
jgi:hypothetical protein